MKRKVFLVTLMLLLLNSTSIFCESWHKLGRFEVMYSPDGLYMYDYSGSERITNLRKENIVEAEFFPAFWAGDDYESTNVAYGKNINKEFIFSVKLGEKILKYDITPLLTERITLDYRDGMAKFCFYENENNLDLVLSKAETKFYLIRFNFSKNTVNIIKIIDNNPVYYNFYEKNCYNILLGKYNNIKSFSNELDEYNQGIFNEDCQYFYEYKNNIITLDCSKTLYNEKFFFGQKKLDITLEQKNSAYRLFPKNKNNYDVTYSYITDCLIKDVSYSSKSELKEGQTVYSASNLATFSDIPWVPSEKDLTKEEIVITSQDKIAALMIGNGFYREDKEYLFLQNRRAKEIVIEYENNPGFKHHVILMDTAFAQPVPLVDINSKSIRIKILSYYEGTKYDDLCINYIGAMKYDYQTVYNRRNAK